MTRESDLEPVFRPIRAITRRKWWITAAASLLTFLNQDEFAIGVAITGKLILTEFNVSLAVSLGNPTLTNEALPEHFRDENFPRRDVWVASRGTSDIFKGEIRYMIAAGNMQASPEIFMNPVGNFKVNFSLIEPPTE